MKERTEKQPIDELFARKLDKMSLPPSPDGFARLQARMGQGGETPKVIFWREPALQRYMAVAACLLLVCLFGWLYMTNESAPATKGDIAAVNPTSSEKEDQPTKQPIDKPADAIVGTQPVPEQALPGQASAMTTGSPSQETAKPKQIEAQAEGQYVAAVKQSAATSNKLPLEVPVLETVKPMEQIAKTDAKPVTIEPIVEKQEVATVNKPAPVAERVLVVTIAEPEALVAARRTAKATAQEETLADDVDKGDKETKAGAIWSQVKRLKQGEIFARKDEGEDERGLIGRAYIGLKHSLDKDKSTKQ